MNYQEHYENLKKLSDDERINYILGLLKDGYFSDDILNEYITTLNNFDKKIELCKKILEYQEQVKKEYLRRFMIYYIFSDTLQANTQEDADFLVNKLKELLEDNKLSNYIDSYTLESLFEAINDDSLLITTYNKVVNDPLLRKLMNKDVLMSYITCFKDGKTKLGIINSSLTNNILSIKEIEKLLKDVNFIKDKSLFLDKSLMNLIYSNKEFSLSIAELVVGNLPYKSPMIFKEEETKYIEAGRIDDILEKYKTLGIIDEGTLESIYKIASKYIKNLTMEDMIRRISSNPNAKEIIQSIATNSSRTMKIRIHGTGESKTMNDIALDNFAAIFPKSRFGSLPDLVSYKKMTVEMCEKFNVKTWNKLIQNPLFNEDDNTKRALVEIIACSGLFENDPQVELRKRQVIELFENYNLPLSQSDMDSLVISDKEWITSHFDLFTIKKYKLREGITIPIEFASWLSLDLTAEQMARIKKETGNIGSLLTKYLSPYVREGNVWKLRNGVNIDLYSDYLKTEMSNEEYMSLLTSNDTPKEIINFLNPYEEIKEQGYRIKQSLNNSDRSEVIRLILISNLNNRYTFESIHRMFDGLDLSFNPEFYEFFMNNQDQILSSADNQAYLKDVRRKFDLIKKYYASRGNSNPNYNDMVMYLAELPYTITFGNEEFAQDAKNTQVSDEGYAFYENLLEETRKRHLTTVPRHEKKYEYEAPNGKKYQVIAKVLRADDPFNLLVGETKFTNCCQRYHREGEACMKHASTSQNGGIFATYLIIDGVPTMLTQSWFWTNESKACLDNVEATSLITGASGDKKRLLQDIAAFAIKSACTDMMKTSKEKMNAYIEEKTRVINNSAISEEEKSIELRKLEVLRQRQTLKIITVGEGCDDINVIEHFTQIEDVDKSYGPKGYEGYRDSTGAIEHRQHIIVQSGERILPVDYDYEDVPIYRDDREIKTESGENIRRETLRKITDIESFAHKDQMVQYIVDGKYKIKTPEELAKLYGCFLEDLKVLHGEDWYYVYSDDGVSIEVYDFAKKEPRIDDEGMEQTIEMAKAFEKILAESIIFDENGNVSSIKPIKASLREDTSYILYLTQKKRGLIEQIKDDVSYPFLDNSKRSITSSTEQDKILGNYQKIKENNNPDMIMHEVSFKPSLKEIERILAIKQNGSMSFGRTM